MWEWTLRACKPQRRHQFLMSFSSDTFFYRVIAGEFEFNLSCSEESSVVSKVMFAPLCFITGYRNLRRGNEEIKRRNCSVRYTSLNVICLNRLRCLGSCKNPVGHQAIRTGCYIKPSSLFWTSSKTFLPSSR